MTHIEYSIIKKKEGRKKRRKGNVIKIPFNFSSVNFSGIQLKSNAEQN